MTERRLPPSSFFTETFSKTYGVKKTFDPAIPVSLTIFLSPLWLEVDSLSRLIYCYVGNIYEALSMVYGDCVSYACAMTACVCVCVCLGVSGSRAPYGATEPAGWLP